MGCISDEVALLLILLTAFVLFGAIALSSTLGFGAALLAMPILTALLGLKTATPLFALVGSTANICIVLLSWDRILLKTAWRLFLGTLLGIPFGIILIQRLPEPLIVGALGVLLILFGLARLLNRSLPPLNQSRWGYGVGFIAGILGGAYNTNGPPVVMYGTMRQWPPTTFRATLHGYFLPAGLVILLSHAFAGLWSEEVLTLYLWSVPGVLIGVGIGQYWNQRLPVERFNRMLSAMVILLGFMLIQRFIF